MTALTASTVPVAVRIRNDGYDGMITGWLIGAPTFTKGDPGGYIAGSFVVPQWLAYRSGIVMDYSRVYFYDKCSGDTLFEGDITHPGRATADDGALLEIQVDGGAERLHDWSGARIYCDRDLEAWKKVVADTLTSTTIEAGEDRGGSGADALNISFAQETHVENNYAGVAIYERFHEADQEIGRYNYSWDGGHTSGSPGWLVQSIVTPPSTLVRSTILNVGGGAASGAVRVTSFPTGADEVVLQLIWTSGSSSTGVLDNVWVSYLGLSVTARMYNKDGTDLSLVSYQDYVTAEQVWNDMLGTELLNTAFDGANATIETGSAFQIQQLAYPDGITPADIATDLMTFEPAMTYFVGPSIPGIDKYSLRWVVRSTVVRYEVMVWADEHTNGTQEVDQYNQAVVRWKTPTGNSRITVATQSIPEMDAVGRVRRYFQDLTDTLSDSLNADQANATVLGDHRYPQNTGQVKVARPIVDLFTGRRVEPFAIEPGYLVRLVGVEPRPDSLNASSVDGSTICRIVTTSYDGNDHAATLDLDSIPVSMFKAIADTKRPRPVQKKR